MKSSLIIFVLTLFIVTFNTFASDKYNQNIEYGICSVNLKEFIKVNENIYGHKLNHTKQIIENFSKPTQKDYEGNLYVSLKLKEDFFITFFQSRFNSDDIFIYFFDKNEKKSILFLGLNAEEIFNCFNSYGISTPMLEAKIREIRAMKK